MTTPHASAPDIPFDATAPTAVGVVMPAFNAERTIEAAVRSVLTQTWRNLELVVCDDNSSDNTRAVLATIGDPRLKVVASQINQGPGTARDRAIAATAAPWIAVIDADDEWDPRRIEVLMAARGDAHDVMVFDDLMQCHDVTDELIPWRRLRGNAAFGERSSMPRDVPVERFVVASRLLIKPLFPAATLHAHSITHSQRPFGEDTEFFLRLAAAGLRLRYVPEPMYRYRITPGSATASAPSRTLMRECLMECSELPGLPAKAREALESKIRSLARDESLYALRELLRKGAYVEFARTLAMNPKLLPSGARRAASILGYEFHRMLHGGRGR
jgi:succinoglycan biosynthesis protein ExoO